MVTISRRQALCVSGSALTAAMSGFTATSFAQSASGKPLSLRVAYPAGGPADVATRKIQGALQQKLGRTVIVENFPGANGSIGANNVLQAPPDGNTLLVTTGNDMILAPLAIAQARYRSADFRLVANIFPSDMVLVSNADHAFTSADDVVERTRGSGGKELTIGSWGRGSATYLVGADFGVTTGARLLDVPYKGVAPVIQGLLTREIGIAFTPTSPGILDLIRTGKLKAIGVASDHRNPFLPDTPTLNEGKKLRNFVYTGWAGVFAATTVPLAVVEKVSGHLAEIVPTKEYQDFLKDSAALPVGPMTLEQAAEFYRRETEKFQRIAKAIKLEPQ